MMSRLKEGEGLFAHLDDFNVMCDPTRVAEVHSTKEMWRHARIQIHQEKTKIWNKGRGCSTVGSEDLEFRARTVDPDAIVWRGNGDIPSTKQGLKIFGCPFWPRHVISSRTSSLSCQTAMTFCWAASPWWRICAAVGSCGSVVQLHEPISSCGQSVMGKSPLLFLATTTRCGHVSAVCWKVDLRECYLFFRIGAFPLRLGGLGFSSALRLRHAVHRASWADCILMVHQRHPIVEVGSLRAGGSRSLLGTSLAPFPLSTLAMAKTGHRVRGRDFEPPWAPDEFCDGTDLP